MPANHNNTLEKARTIERERETDLIHFMIEVQFKVFYELSNWKM